MTTLTAILASLQRLDRRWIFLAMLIAVLIPVLTRVTYPETPTAMTSAVFNKIESLPPGSRILLPLDYDPGSEAELGPMAKAVIRHSALKRHKMYFLTLWPTGLPLLERNLRQIIEEEFKEAGLKYGVDYVNLGYVPGEAVAVKLLATDFRKARGQDNTGTSLDRLPMMQQVGSAQDMDLIMAISAGYPGAKEWVLFAAIPNRIPLGMGVTGVAAPQMYPYYPNQVVGLITAIKGAAEYETALAAAYPEQMSRLDASGIQRMGPQLWAHRLMIVLIVVGNILQLTRGRGGRK